MVAKRTPPLAPPSEPLPRQIAALLRGGFGGGQGIMIDPATGAPLWVDTNSEWTEWQGMRRFVVDASDTLHATWWSRSGNASSTFGGVNLGITGGGWQSFVVAVQGATGAVTDVSVRL